MVAILVQLYGVRRVSIRGRGNLLDIRLRSHHPRARDDLYSCNLSDNSPGSSRQALVDATMARRFTPGNLRRHYTHSWGIAGGHRVTIKTK